MAKVLISVSDDLLRLIDRRAKARGTSRSAYLAELARRDVRSRPDASAVEAIRRARELCTHGGVDTEPDIDSTEYIRRMRDAR